MIAKWVSGDPRNISYTFLQMSAETQDAAPPPSPKKELYPWLQR